MTSRATLGATAFLCLGMSGGALAATLDIPPALTTNPCGSESPLADVIRLPGLATGIDRVFEGFVRADGPGAMVAVVRNGDVVHLQGYGIADLAFGSRWTPTTRYRLASITKTFTATAVLELVERQQLRLDARVSSYLPDLSVAARGITIGNLLSMSSGLWQDEDLMELTGNALVALDGPARHMSVKDMEAYAAIQDRLDFLPGTVFRYVDTNYRLLARVIEKATGKSYAAALNDLVLAPAGMPNSAPFPTLDSTFRCQVPTYVQSGGQWKDIGVYALAALGDGAMVSTMRDMLSWTRYMSARRPDGKPSRYVRLADVENGTVRPASMYRLGIMMFRHRGYVALGHQGATGTLFAFVPDLDLIVLLFTNGFDEGVRVSPRNRDLAAQVIDAVLDSSGSAGVPAPAFAVSATTLPLQRVPLPAGLFPSGTFLCESLGEVLDIDNRGDVAEVALMGLRLDSWARSEPGVWHGIESHLQVRMSKAVRLSPGAMAVDLQEVDSETPCRFVSVAPARLAPDAATGLSGWYYTSALRTHYRIHVDEGDVYLAAANDTRPGARRVLTRLSPDVLRSGPLVLRLSRDGNGHVTGFLLSTGRVRNVPFRKLDES